MCVRLDEWLCFKFICMNSNSKIFSYSAESDTVTSMIGNMLCCLIFIMVKEL